MFEYAFDHNNGVNSMQNEIECEICGCDTYKEYDYPIGWEKRFEIEKQKLAYGKILRNNAKYLAKALLSRMPKLGISRFDALRARAVYRQLIWRSQLPLIAQNLRRGASLFKDKKINVCQDCGFGALFPPLSEQTLNEYYSGTYWLSMANSLEPCENSRTVSIYDMVRDHIPFDRIGSSVELGSASAQLSRYFKQRHPQLEISMIEPGKNWHTLLHDQVKAMFTNIHEVKDKYDLFFSSHSLEHIPDIKKYFRRIVDMVSDGGYLIFEVPNSVEADVIFDKANGDYHIPHTYFFTESAFARLAERHGLQVLVMKTFNRSYSQSLNNVQNGITSTMENPDGSRLRVLLQKNVKQADE